MKIENKSAETIRAELIRDVRGVGAGARGAQTGQPVPGVERADRVQISDAGRALAAHTQGPTEGELSEERIAEIRTRILEGAYNSLEVVDEVARRMLRSGDL